MNKRLESYIKNELPKEKDDYEKILMLYSLGLLSAEEIYQYTKIGPIDKIKVVIYNIEKEGKYTDFLLEDIIRIYNSGVIDVNEIAEITGEKIGTVISKIQKAVILGRVVIKTVPTGNYAKVVELAKQNKNDEQILEETGLPYSLVSRYLNRAVEEGHIEERSNEICGKLKKIVDLTLEGKDEEFIIKSMQISKTTYQRYYKIAVDKKLIPKKRPKREKEEKTIEDKIFYYFSQYTYTIDVARKLKIDPYQLYEIIENFSDDKKEVLFNIRLNSNPLYPQAKRQADVKECDLESALDEMVINADYNRLFSIARLYYILGKYPKALATFYQILNVRKNESGIKDTVILEKRKIKVDMIRKDFLENQYSTMYLCKKYDFDKEVIESIINSREKNRDFEL